MAFLDKFFNPSVQALNRYQKAVEGINQLESNFKPLSHEEIQEQVKTWKAELAGKDFDEQQKILNRILPEVFAITREAAHRSIGQRHFDVQLIGGMALHNGQIAEMRTGEGKTLTATLAVVLNALTGNGVHLVTVNDYLARWHASLMGPVYHYLGISVASIQHERSFIYDPSFQPEQEEIEQIESETQGLVLDVKHMRPVSRREAYAADITYGTNNEFGFDYLRDNMVSEVGRMTQRGQHYAIIDEVDSILIDEARTPLIISAPDTDPTDKYYHFSKLVLKLEENTDYNIDEKKKAIALTEDGIAKLEKLLNVKNIYEEEGIGTVHHLEQALRAQSLFKRDRDYVVRDGEVVIVDEFTGRLMFGRRYSDGLHQAIEAKENVEIQQESKTLATITFQNYFRMYDKLSGMTGTAQTEAEEFYRIYKLEVVTIPTNRPMIREDFPDLVYKSEKGKFEAILKDVQERHAKGQPILIGTVSIQKNELLAEYLSKAGLKFELLNAKNHEREAHIISQAGRFGAITIATNIAGRGVDILLGGSTPDPDEAEKVKEAGGLHVIGTERHESRRIDNQLRGRSGRQGDPGSSRFYVSVEDDLMRLFGGDRLKSLMQRLGIPEDQPIEHKLVSTSIEQAQKKIEGFNYDARKHVLEYDDVMNRQREVIYKKRREWLDPSKKTYEEFKADVLEMIKGEIDLEVQSHFLVENDLKELLETLNTIFPVTPKDVEEITNLSTQAGNAEFVIADYAKKVAEERFEEKEKAVGDTAIMHQLMRFVALQSLDTLWMQHLDTMEHLRDSVGLRGYGQRDPLVEYKREGFQLFQRLLAGINHQIVNTIYKVNLVRQPLTEMERATQQGVNLKGGSEEVISEPVRDEFSDIGRNDPCPCGSGKKYKKCGLLNTPEHQENMAKKA